MSPDGDKALSVAEMLAELAETASPIRAALIYMLSEPTQDDLDTLKAMWGSLPTERRQTLIGRLLETSETSFEFDFSEVARFAVDDRDDLVRKYAAATLWTNEEPETMRLLIDLVKHDESALVRSAAAEALGQFILNSELGKIEEALSIEAREALLSVLESGDELLDVKRRALESLAFSGSDEVVAHIRQAHASDSIEMQASAIFAMGRSADNRWDEDVLEALHDDSEEPLLYEAARAAGELLLQSSVDRLIDLMLSTDREIRDAAIWSLGEIGGKVAQNALMNLFQNAEDEELIEALEDAIANAQLVDGDSSAFAFDSEPDDYEE